MPDGRQVLFRPSLYAMTQLGSPKEIVQLFSDLHEPPRLGESFDFDTPGAKAQMGRINAQIVSRYKTDMLFLSWRVLYACADVDPKDFIGEPGTRYNSYRPGNVPPEVMLVMARTLLRHGLIGPPIEVSEEQAKAAEGQQKKPGAIEFDAMAFVSRAVTHLGMSEDEAWNMTITSFGSHWASKYGENKEKRHSEEHDKTMAWLTEVNKARAQLNG